MSRDDEPLSAVLGRQRARSRIRAITLTVGAAGLATAGYIAYHLPAPAPRPANAGTSGASATGAPPAGNPAPSYGDDGGEGEGRVAAPTPASAPAAGAPATSHATSGGS